MQFFLYLNLWNLNLFLSDYSALHLAADEGYSGIIELLLPLNDIDINMKTILRHFFLIKFNF